MNATPSPPDVARQGVSDPSTLTADAHGALGYVWMSKFGPMLIEVKAGVAYVNGQEVEPAAPAFHEAGSPPRR